MSIPQEQQVQNKEMIIAVLVLQCLFMRYNEKCNIPYIPQHQLKQYPIINTKCIGVIDPESPEKNITTLSFSLATSCGRHIVLNARCYKAFPLDVCDKDRISLQFTVFSKLSDISINCKPNVVIDLPFYILVEIKSILIITKCNLIQFIEKLI